MENFQFIDKETKLDEINHPEFNKLKISVIKLNVSHYKIDGFGSFCLLEGKGMLSLVKMKTIVLLPLSKKYPMLSLERMKMGKKNIFIAELYDFNGEEDQQFSFNKYQERLKDLPNHKTDPCWYESLYACPAIYKDGSKKDNQLFDDISNELLKDYLDMARNALVLDDNESQSYKNNVSMYRERLLNEGGVSTNMFIKYLGKERTRQFFEKVMFPTNI